MTTNRQPLSDDEISEQLKSLPGWERDGDKLKKLFKFGAYTDGLIFATLVGAAAEKLDHHPDIHIGWRKVTVTFSTHDAGNKITVVDVKAAQAVEGLPYKAAG